MAKRKNSSKRQSRIRIIGGEWRSRQLPFVEVAGLRPTPDRIRETLFNWLQGRVAGARCLDLFAGSGAMGLEALSRYADEVVLVEMNSQASQQLKDNLGLLQGSSEARGTVICGEAMHYLKQRPEPFDLIFLDPPYRQGLLPEVLSQLQALALLKPDGLIYLEHESEQPFDCSTWNLRVVKQSAAGQVCSLLLEYDASGGAVSADC